MAVNQTTTSKEKILKKVRQALIYKSKPKFANIDLESPVYAVTNDVSPLETFARNFTGIQGQFVMCDNNFDFVDKLITLQERRKYKKLHCWEEALQSQLRDSGISFHPQGDPVEKAQVALTSCEGLIARTGSVLISSAKNSRILTIYPPVLIIVAYASQVVHELKDGLQRIRNRYGKNVPSMLCFVSGPAFTDQVADAHVAFAHGPKELFVFLIDDL